MKISTDILAAISVATTSGPQLTLTGQLDRKLYQGVAKAIEAAGGKWNRKAGAHVFDGDAAEAIESLLLTGEITHARDDFDFFPTPAAVVDRLVRLADVPAGAMLLEPSAGRGAILAAFKGAAVLHAIELLDDNVRHLKSLGWVDSVTQGDFLKTAPTPIYDRIVMNPPFSKRADIHHVNHAAKFLKPGGRLVSVMSASVVFRSDRLATDFRAMVEANGGGIEPLPAGSFLTSGTGVNTCTVKFWSR